MVIHGNQAKKNNDHNGYHKALNFHNQALSIRLKTLDTLDIKIAISYSNIGKIYQDMKEYGKAIDFGIKACRIIEKSLPNHPYMGVMYHYLAIRYRLNKDFDNALAMQKKGLDFFLERGETSTINIANAYDNYFHIYFELKNYELAYSYALKILDIFKRKYPDGHPHLDKVNEMLKQVKEKL